jgi:peptide/nickel transport system permease protein
MGTDDLGRDVFSRMVHGARLSMEISLLAMILTTAAGTVVGLLSAYYKSMDGLLMRIMDGLMAFPAILLAIAIIAALGASAMNVVLALSLVLTPTMSRVVRSAALTVSHMEFTTAARATGSRDSRIIFRHILPNCLSPIIVQATFVFAQSVLAEAALSFLGVGAPPPAPSWGNILSDGRNYLNMAPWLTIFPGVAISLSVLSLNVVGDTLRDALDPRLRT